MFIAESETLEQKDSMVSPFIYPDPFVDPPFYSPYIAVSLHIFPVLSSSSSYSSYSSSLTAVGNEPE